jgi:hypothetical protein
MYLCICCNITTEDVAKDPELLKLVGSVCGKCLSDGDDLESTDVRRLDRQLD